MLRIALRDAFDAGATADQSFDGAAGAGDPLYSPMV
jgi:hypothetical protein